MSNEIMDNVAKNFELSNMKLISMDERINKNAKELEKLKSISLNRLTKIGEISNTIATTESKLKKIKDSEANVGKIQKENRNLLLEIQKSKRKVVELQEDLRKLRTTSSSNLSDIESREGNSPDRRVITEEDNQQENNQLDNSKEKLNDYDKINSIQSEIKRLEDELAKSNEENKRMEDRHSALKVEIEKLSEEIKEKAEDNKRIQEEMEEAQQRCSATLTKCQFEKFGTENEEENNRNEIIEANESDEVDNKVSYYLEKIDDLKAKLKAADDEYYEM